jgi:restriction system protein
MTVPDFQSIMLPFLKIAGDGREHSFSETVEILAQQLLSGEDLKEMLPSGQSRWMGAHPSQEGGVA